MMSVTIATNRVHTPSFACMLHVAAALFFVLPAIWLMLAPTKTAYQLDHAFPLSFGSFATVRSNNSAAFAYCRCRYRASAVWCAS